MRETLTSFKRKQISEFVKEGFNLSLIDEGFENGKSKTLWSKNFENCIGYIRLKRVSTFSEWPHFQLNFGLTPLFSKEIEAILKNLLKSNQPMYEIWANRVRTPTEHFKLRNSARYSSANPGTWEFRSSDEAPKKLHKMQVYVSDYFSGFVDSHATDEHLAAYPLGIIDELPANFRVLQIVACGRLRNLSRIKDIISYYTDNSFDKNGSKFMAPVREYGDPLLRYFSQLHPQTAHPPND